jgi:hypothetical protein
MTITSNNTTDEVSYESTSSSTTTTAHMNNNNAICTCIHPIASYLTFLKRLDENKKWQDLLKNRMNIHHKTLYPKLDPTKEWTVEAMNPLAHVNISCYLYHRFDYLLINFIEINL